MKIEKNIPIPAPEKPAQNSFDIKVEKIDSLAKSIPFGKMEIGDSFFIKTSRDQEPARRDRLLEGVAIRQIEYHFGQFNKDRASDIEELQIKPVAGGVRAWRIK